MAIVDRVKAICSKPKETWEVIAGETSSPADLLKNYAFPLAAISAVAGFIGNALFTRSMPIASGLVGGVLMLAMVLASAYVLGLIIDALAPRFGAQKDKGQALKVAVYSATPAWAAGVLFLIPPLAPLVWLAFFYGIYVLYLGLQRLMKSPIDKTIGYTAAIAGCWVALMIVGRLIVGAIVAVG
jgi:hypothetical protein